MANKHEIKGYIYVTSDEEIEYFYLNTFNNEIDKCDDKISQKNVNLSYWLKKIILTNNPNLPIQQLTEIEVEYLKSVDSFEVEKIGYKKNGMIDESTSYNYKILIPKETEKERGITITNVSEQPKESIEEVVKEKYKGEYICNGVDIVPAFREGFIDGYNHAKQTLYTEDEVINLIKEISSEIEIRKQNIISNSKKISQDMLEGGCMAFESSQNTVKEWFNKHKK